MAIFCKEKKNDCDCGLHDSPCIEVILNAGIL